MAPGDRETLDVDVLFVGGGPAGLVGAIRLRQLLKARNEKIKKDGAGAPLELSVALLEKGREIGSHAISGAVLDPKALRELFPDFEVRGCPLESPVTDDGVWFLTRNRKLPLPIVPPPLRNHGNYVASLGKVVRWLAQQAEAEGVDLFPGFAAAEPLLDGDRVIGVRTGDKGIDREGRKKANFEPGIDIRAKVTVLAEGPRGTLTKMLVNRFHLDQARNPQVYAVGIKEVWECPKGSLPKGRVTHTMGFPLDRETFGGAFIYTMAEDLLDIGLVVGLDYRNPRLDPHALFQTLKTHPAIAPMLRGAKVLSYGAEVIPEALVAGDTSAAFLSRYEERFRRSWAGRELWRVRNFHAGFRNGLVPGLIHSALQMATFGRGLRDPLPVEPGHTRPRTLAAQFRGASPPPDQVVPRYDAPLMIDKLTDVFHSGTKHDEDQPVHLHVADTGVCETRCAREYGNPCQHFCPAAVYEMVPKEGGGRRLQINASNCVHCKTCDIMDPYQIITWVPPEGGGGPEYVKL